MIASHVVITTLTHDYHEECMQGTLLQKAVVIEDDVWVGAYATIMAGVTFGKEAVVEAGSVVTKNVEPYSIVVVGVPANLLKYRPVLGASEKIRIFGSNVIPLETDSANVLESKP